MCTCAIASQSRLRRTIVTGVHRNGILCSRAKQSNFEEIFFTYFFFLPFVFLSSSTLLQLFFISFYLVFISLSHYLVSVLSLVSPFLRNFLRLRPAFVKTISITTSLRSWSSRQDPPLHRRRLFHLFFCIIIAPPAELLSLLPSIVVSYLASSPPYGILVVLLPLVVGLIDRRPFIASVFTSASLLLLLLLLIKHQICSSLSWSLRSST